MRTRTRNAVAAFAAGALVAMTAATVSTAPTAGAGTAPSGAVPMVRVVLDDVAGDLVLPALAAANGAAGTVGDVDRLAALDALVLDVPVARIDAVRAALRSVAPEAAFSLDGRARSFDVVPNDPLWGLQSASGAVGLPAAWATTTGSVGATIAVVDTGVTANTELSGRLLGGWDFVDGDADTSDPVGHGTAAALVAAAAGDNGVGGAGACWSCRVLPVRVLDGAGEGYLSSIAAGIVFAADHGASVMNLSLGASVRSPLVSDAVRYAQLRGVLVVAAAGNDGVETPMYPAAEPGVVSVGAANSFSTLYSWSQRGATVDLAAPGCNLASLDSTYVALDDDFCGTSSAAPLVSGTAALVRSHRPGAGRAQVANALLASADGFPGNLVTKGFLDAPGALAAVDAVGAAELDVSPLDDAAPTASVRFADIPFGVGAAMAVEVAGADHGGATTPITTIELLVDWQVVARGGAGPDGATSFTWDTRSVPDGTHELRGRVVDSVGKEGISSPSNIVVDNTRPGLMISAPATGRAGQRITVVVAAADANRTQATFLALGDQVVGGFVGNGMANMAVTLPRSGRHRLLAASIDHAGNFSFSNVVWVDIRRSSRRR